MLIIVTLKLNSSDTLPFAPTVNNPFPLSVEWEQSNKSTYRFEQDGVIRYKRNTK